LICDWQKTKGTALELQFTFPAVSPSTGAISLKIHVWRSTHIGQNGVSFGVIGQKYRRL
jgi:hypothetical protein